MEILYFEYKEMIYSTYDSARSPKICHSVTIMDMKGQIIQRYMRI